MDKIYKKKMITKRWDITFACLLWKRAMLFLLCQLWSFISQFIFQQKAKTLFLKIDC